MMRIILAGSRSFGAAVYELLIEEHDIAAVWSPDRELMDATTDRLTQIAFDDGVWSTPAERDPTTVARLEVDLFVAAHSHDFISSRARRATKLGGIGYHPSLLPRHRGRDAVEWTIRMGDAVTGGTVYWLTDNVDGGPVAWQQHAMVIPGETASELWRRELFGMGLEGLQASLREIESGLLVELDQDERCATWEPSIGRPPLHRPDLPQLGAGVPGYRHVVRREGLRGPHAGPVGA